jgi:hypothetical protein
MERRADGLLGVVSQCLPLAWTLLVCPANKILVMNETMQIYKELQPWHSNVVEISKISSNPNGIDALAKPSITAQDQLLSFHVMPLQRLAFVWRFRQCIRVALRMSLPIKKTPSEESVTVQLRFSWMNNIPTHNSHSNCHSNTHNAEYSYQGSDRWIV